MNPSNVKVIVCDLHARTSGVSTTIRAQLPHLNESIDYAFVAKRDDPHKKAISLLKAFLICRSRLPENIPFRIWHARRNNEMIWGLIFKYLFRCKIQLLFTSAAKRRHSWFPRKLIQGMDKIIATTKEAASFVSKVDCVIGHGVDHQVFKPAKNKTKLTEQLNLLSGINVAIVGRVRPEKGTDVFVDAMIKVMQKSDQVQAYVFGLTAKKHQSFANQLKQKIKSADLENRFHWMGVVDIHKMPDYMACMDVTVAPAKYEGYGMVPLEAMACKNAVLATDTGAYKVMIEQGKSGYIIKDTSDLIQKLDFMLSDPEQINVMGENGYQRVLQYFTLEKEVNSILDVYQRWWREQTGKHS